MNVERGQVYRLPAKTNMSRHSTFLDDWRGVGFKYLQQRYYLGTRPSRLQNPDYFWAQTHLLEHNEKYFSLVHQVRHPSEQAAQRQWAFREESPGDSLSALALVAAPPILRIQILPAQCCRSRLNIILGAHRP